MGGLGSGRRSNSKATTSDYGRLDVRSWQRQGLLAVGRFVCWPWNVEVIMSPNRDEPNMIRLYHCNQSDQHGEPHPVRLSWTPCNYGGKRAWFICPRGCGHRAAILYYGDSSPSCRHCRQLSYESQHDSGWHRSLRRARATRMRLGGSANLTEPLPGKPKGMHWGTYRRLFSKATAREQIFLGGALTVLTSLEKSISRLNGRV
ncbi:MAG: uncharacterized protein JWQ87_3561 [Candidatus Sulfotelmatobacter sp.]|nr:uncharacterized protein [Candidatus Sulfotelmatobacter sp.]